MAYCTFAVVDHLNRVARRACHVVCRQRMYGWMCVWQIPAVSSVRAVPICEIICADGAQPGMAHPISVLCPSPSCNCPWQAHPIAHPKFHPISSEVDVVCVLLSHEFQLAAPYG